MPSVRSLASKRRAHIVTVIFLLGEIIPTYSYCVFKGLVYIAIIAPLGYQLSFYIKCTKLNIHLSCDIRLVSNTKYAFFICSCVL